MSDRIAGRFYFKRTSNGNLIGEWSNNDADRTFSESCDLAEPNDNSFIGTYNSSWREGGEALAAKLKITKQRGQLFSLEWRGDADFDGEGMLCDDTLIGDYHQHTR